MVIKSSLMKMEYLFVVIFILLFVDSVISFYSSHGVSSGPLGDYWRNKNWNVDSVKGDDLKQHPILSKSFTVLSSNQPPKSWALNLFRNLPNIGSGGNLDTEVGIESPSMNSRRITASIVVDDSIENVWKILTDYDSLSENVPNLVKSYVVPSPKQVTRIFQEGAQKIIGFEFRASLMMDMTENLDARYVYNRGGNDYSKQNINAMIPPREIGFKLVESTMFSEFTGTWTLVPLRSVKDSQVNSRINKGSNGAQQTKVIYSVFIRPKGPVPILALEWRIREDVPVNLIAVKAAAENLGRRNGGRKASDKIMKASAATAIAAKAAQDAAKVAQDAGIDWGIDETLGQYMGF